MSQKPFMWNDNDPIAFADPNGYDIIEMVARPVFVNLPIPLVHIFIFVMKDSGSTKKYSFGPSSDVHPFGSKIISRTYAEDSVANATGVTVIGWCKGTCTLSNGGFNEPGLDATAAAINSGNFEYKKFQNSNSAAYTECVQNGGKNCGSTDTGLLPAPGDSNNLLNGGSHDRVQTQNQKGQSDGSRAQPERYYDAQTDQPL